MLLVQQIAKQFRAVHFGGNWTAVNLKDTLDDVTWQQSITQVDQLNAIATLVFHMNYYVLAVLKVLQGEPLTASDRYSFDLPPITSDQDWKNLVAKTFIEAELFAKQVEQLEESELVETFVDAKYGNYYRNLLGVIEHTHYHLGQISLIKKIVQGKMTAP